MSKPNLRRSQLITTFGPGSLVNLLVGSYVGMGIDHWPQPGFEDRIYDDRLQKRLGKKFFVQPPSNETNPTGLPYRRFPRWFFCPKCRVLQKYEQWDARKPRDNAYARFSCPDDNATLVPMNFLVACLKGHIDDFPWSKWVHKGKELICPENAPLKYTKGGSGAGLRGALIKCTGCGSTKDMRGSFSQDAFGDLKCYGPRPWTGKDPIGSCGEKMTTVQRGGSNVYFPKIVSSIAIPSAYNNLIEDVKRTTGWAAISSMKESIGMELLSAEAKEKLVLQIATDVGRDANEIRNFVTKYAEGSSEEEAEDITDENYLYDEYAAFHGNYARVAHASRDFQVENVSKGYDYSEMGINSLYMVKALREVRALVGFTRLKPLEVDVEDDDGISSDRPHLVALSERPLNWLPAMEVRGEGIFLTFDEKKLAEWAKRSKVAERLSLINKNLQISCTRRKTDFEPLEAKKIFLHTFAHLLIKQLSFECGYGSASLRERIYCDNGGSNKMQGILIYTAAGDADGTLGGLVRQAKSDRFPAILQGVLASNVWCSNDPLCIESKGQGFESLNLAACYACALLPETSCEMFNRFLDRSFVVGLPEDSSTSFFLAAIDKLS